MLIAKEFYLLFSPDFEQQTCSAIFYQKHLPCHVHEFAETDQQVAE